jgi:hypothetical protein
LAAATTSSLSGNSGAAAGTGLVCDKPEMRAEGRLSDPGSARYKERIARRNSAKSWERLTNEAHGASYSRWRLARDRAVACDHYVEPWLNGRVSCVAVGGPCAKP